MPALLLLLLKELLLPMPNQSARCSLAGEVWSGVLDLSSRH